jgi:hypothetical protein
MTGSSLFVSLLMFVFLYPVDEVGDSDSESDSERPVMLSIPKAKFDSYCTRLADVLLLLPTVDLERGKECRDALVEVAHEMREFSAPKRRLDQVDEAEEKEPHSGKKVKKLVCSQ